MLKFKNLTLQGAFCLVLALVLFFSASILSIGNASAANAVLINSNSTQGYVAITYPASVGNISYIPSNNSIYWNGKASEADLNHALLLNRLWSVAGHIIDTLFNAPFGINTTNLNVSGKLQIVGPDTTTGIPLNISDSSGTSRFYINDYGAVTNRYFSATGSGFTVPSDAGNLIINGAVNSPSSALKVNMNNGYSGWLANLQYASSSKFTVDVNGNTNITGNLSASFFHAGMYTASEIGIPGMTLNSSYQIVNFTNASHLNGFAWINSNALQLTNPQAVGEYQVIWHSEKDGTQNHVYFAKIFVNEVEQNNTMDRAIGQASNAIRMVGIGFININKVGDNVTLRIKDITNPPSAPTVYIKNVNLIRVAN